jgi:hypothetical protein
MTQNYKHLIKLVHEQVKRFERLYNAKGIVKNASERVQRNFSNVQNIANEKYDIVAKVSELDIILLLFNSLH